MRHSSAQRHLSTQNHLHKSFNSSTTKNQLHGSGITFKKYLGWLFSHTSITPITQVKTPSNACIYSFFGTFEPFFLYKKKKKDLDITFSLSTIKTVKSS